MRSKVTIEYDLVTICPLDKSIDLNNIKITYYPTATNYIEFIGLHDFLETLRMKEMLHEQLTDTIYDQLREYNPIVEVSSEFPTLGDMKVTIIQGGDQ